MTDTTTGHHGNKTCRTDTTESTGTQTSWKRQRPPFLGIGVHQWCEIEKRIRLTNQTQSLTTHASEDNPNKTETVDA